MSQCNHDCANCASKCDNPTSFLEKANEFSHVGKVIAVMSGKGGVGKSMVTSMLASYSNSLGFKTAVLDADVTGPSIPKIFGVKDEIDTDGKYLLPAVSAGGIKIMSTNLLLEDETKPVIWRGAIVTGIVKQFWQEVFWGDVDYMFVDMPPGTGDVPLTVFQSLPISSIVVVTSPQQLVSMIVAKAVNMADLMKKKIAGIVENMSYFQCPNCSEKYNIFGESNINGFARQYGIETVAKLPILPELASLSDKGMIEQFDATPYLSDLFERIKTL